MAEHDRLGFGANFFQRIGADGPGEVKPGVYSVEVWWAGSDPNGATGAAFVLKLYQ